MKQARTSKWRRRRGMTVILVLGLLSITVALSYAMLRTQAVSSQIQTNLHRRNEARQAAQTGLMVALRKMHQADWEGVEAPVVGSYQDGLRLFSYRVVLETGDGGLRPGDADYEKFPYRVTLKSTAWTQDPPDYRISSTHTAQAVVELVPRALSTQPANWASLQNHTVHQWADSPVHCQVPVRIEGPIALQGPLQLCEEYPPPSRPWHGHIDEVAIFNKALTQSEIQQIVAAAAAGDGSMPGVYAGLGPIHWWRLNETAGAAVAADSAGGAHGTYQNGTVAGQTGVPIGIANRAAYFDGHNDHIHLGNVDVAGGAMSMLAWFRADSWNGSPDARIISKATGTSASEHVWMLSTASSGGHRRLRFRLRTLGITDTLVAGSGNLQAGRWYCAAAVYSPPNMILYLDGVEVGRALKLGSLTTNAGAPVYIGDNPPGSPQTRYLRDLEAMRAAGQDDWRPLSGPIDMPLAHTDDSTLSLLQEDLNVAANDAAADHTPPVSHPGSAASYQLYPGGKIYTAAVLPSGKQTADLAPDMDANPLGIYWVNGEFELAAGVAVRGTVITGGNKPRIKIEGDNVALAAVPLPPLHGTAVPIELPAAIAAGDFQAGEHRGVQIRGLVYTNESFRYRAGEQAASCDFQGRLLARQLQVEGRNEWQNVSRSQWENRLTQFVNQLSDSNPEPYFPRWLKDRHNLSSEPLLTIRPRSDAVSYHWHDFSQPVFAAHPDDAGLLWQVVRWSENP